MNRRPLLFLGGVLYKVRCRMGIEARRFRIPFGCNDALLISCVPVLLDQLGALGYDLSYELVDIGMGVPPSRAVVCIDDCWRHRS